MTNYGLRRARESDRGISIIEMLVVLCIGGIIMTIGISNLHVLNNPSITSLNQIQGIIKLARSRAISTTMSYIVVPEGQFRVVGKKATSCTDANPVLDPSIRYDLPSGVSFTSTSWSVCFTSRGIANAGVNISVLNSYGITKTIEVMHGGAVRIQ